MVFLEIGLAVVFVVALGLSIKNLTKETIKELKSKKHLTK